MNIRPFEVGLITFFFIAAIGGIVCFSKCPGIGSDEKSVFSDGVEIWGMVDEQVMRTFLEEKYSEDEALLPIRYTRIDPRNFESRLVDAIAEDKSPDLLILPHTLLVSLRTKISPLGFESFPERTFRDSYIDGADIFLLSDGVYGFPFAVDPLVMYWNKDIFSSAGLATPPKTWESLVSQTVKALVQRNGAQDITQSAIALGEYANITYAKEILAMLLLQAGNTITKETDGEYRVVLNEKVPGALSPANAVITFYTQFATRNRELYTWNRSMQQDRSEFLNGTLGLYIGKGSDYRKISRENPNLNFDVTMVPQGSGATVLRDYGDFYAFVIPRASGNRSGAFAAAQLFSNPTNGKKLADALGFAPTHRGAHTGGETDKLRSVIYTAALIAHGWLDPSPRKSGDVFKEMVEAVTSGGVRVDEVMEDGVYKLEALF